MNALSFLFAASVFAAPTYAQCGTPDALEDNDDCASAVAVPGNSATGLNVEDVDLDFYTLTVQDSEQVTIDVSFLSVRGDLDAYLWDPTVACGSTINGEGPGNGALAIGYSSSDDEQIVYANFTGAAQDLVLEVRLYSVSLAACNEYDLNMTFGPAVPSPCATPDQFEPNTDCATATAVGSGSYTGLNIEDTDNDYYAVTVAPNTTLDVEIFFAVFNGDLDLYLWDPTINCDTNVAGAGSADALAMGFSATNNENLSYTNTSNAPQNLIIEVDHFEDGVCSTYDLDIFGATNPTGALGTPFCNPGVVNTTGMVGVAGYEGSLSVAANNATLTAMNLPANQFGIFVTSTTIVAPVSIADGQLCLGGNLGRYQQFSQIWGSGPTGNDGSLVIDLTAIPTTGPLVSAMVGETRGFQGWFRDTGPAGANFTEGIAVTFTP